MTTLAWVLGEGGLLGSHVAHAVRRTPRLAPWSPEGAPLAWEDPLRLEEQIAAAARAFAGAAGARADGWCVFWCAGVGVVGTSAYALAKECSAWELFLSRLGREIAASPAAAQPGLVFLASSAGGVYAGSPERPLTERSPTAPLSAYGRAKLRQERALAAWVAGRGGVSSLVARISNLYGPGQNLDKPQGLVSRVSQCLIRGEPVQLYVPLDTARDYVYAADAGGAIVRWMLRLADETAAAGAPVHVVKICASETETTVAGIVGAFRQTSRRRVRLVTATRRLHPRQPPQLKFRSVVWPDEPPPAETSLHTGIDRLHKYQLALYLAGALPAAPAPHGA